MEEIAVESGIETDRFWHLTFPEVERELTSINNRREFMAAQAANVANFAFSEETATLNKFLGRDVEEESNAWAKKAYMWFDAMSKLDDEDVGS